MNLPAKPKSSLPRRAGETIAPMSEAQQRRLSDKVRQAFHAACDEGAIDVAVSLLEQMETVIKNPPQLPDGINHRRPESIAGPCERLANLVLWRFEFRWGDGTRTL